MSGALRKRSKSLSYWLRHKPDAGGLSLDGQGWAATAEVLRALAAKGLETDIALLERVVRENDKQRFEFSEDRQKIRARQGHSIAVEGDWQEEEPAALLYHGTVERFLEAIFAEGLKPMKRHHVHLSPDQETATKVGQRRGDAVILEVAAGEMAAAGIKFFRTSNGVWLVDAVPPEFLRRLG